MEKFEEKGISLQEMLAILWSNIWYLIVSVVIFTTIGTVYVFQFTAPKYRTSCDVVVLVKGSGSTSDSDLVNAARLLQTVADTFTRVETYRRAARELNTAYGSAETPFVGIGEIASGINVRITTNNSSLVSYFITVSFTDSDPERSGIILDQVVKTVVNATGDISVSNSLEIKQYGEVSPATRITANKSLYIAGGFMVGAVLGFAVIALREILNNKIRGEEDMARITQVPVIGILPFIEEEASSDAF